LEMVKLRNKQTDSTKFLTSPFDLCYLIDLFTPMISVKWRHDDHPLLRVQKLHSEEIGEFLAITF
jgi:hypothetical protein